MEVGYNSPLWVTKRNLLAAVDEYCEKQWANLDPDYAESLEELNAFSITLGVFLWIAAMLALVPQVLNKICHTFYWRLSSVAKQSITY